MADTEIIELIKSGKNDKALIELYQGFPLIQKFLLKNGANKEEALDVFQDALYIFCKNVQQNQFTLTAKISTYLYTVCKYLWKDQLKLKNKILVLETDVPEVENTNFLEEETKINLAEKALKSLGEKCLAILKSFYIEELNMELIAQKFQFSSVNSAKNQKYKCLEKAKHNYQDLSNHSSLKF